MKSKATSAKTKKVASVARNKALRCTVCGKETIRLVDGEPSCDDHAALVYENQLEDYTKEHLKDKVPAKV
jgi:hypothetical protein